MTKEQIALINEKCPYNQGIFKEPYGIPVKVKEPVIYMRWKTGGVSGGNYRDDSNPTRYRNEEAKPKFEALDIVLRELKPEISWLQFREIENLIHTNSETEYEYYGNSTDWSVEYIILSELEAKLKTF